MNCKDQGTTPPEVTTPVISGIELSSDQIIVSDSLLITATLSEELGKKYLLKWKLSGYQTDIDSLTSDVVFSWKAPKVNGNYEHSIQIVSVTGEPISEAHQFSTEISSVPVNPVEGNKLVFSMPEGEDGFNQIFSMNIDGTELTQLTFLERNDAYSPSWSPDGKHIVFTSSYLGTSAGPAVYLMNADGTNFRPMKPSPDSTAAYFGKYPKWSPDGTMITFSSGGLSNDIMVYNFESDSVIQLTSHPTYNSQPYWSPDSKQIVFTSNREYFNADSMRYRTDLYVISADGQNLKRLTEYGYILDPVWSKNGELIAFRDIRIPNKLGSISLENGEIEILEDTFPDEGLVFPHPVSWSIDDKKIFIRLTVHPYDTFVILDIETGEAEKIAFEQKKDVDVDWYQYEE